MSRYRGVGWVESRNGGADVRSSMLIFVALSLTSGCADFSLEATRGSGGSDTGVNGAADSANETDTGGEDSFEASWYTLTAHVRIDGGQASVEDAEVHLAVSDGAGGRYDCDSLDLATLAAASAPASETPLYAWWTLSLPADPGCPAGTYPTTLGFGIGALDPEVRARLGTEVPTPDATKVWGAWFSANGGELFAFGYAAGTGDVAADGPPPDGEYDLNPLLLVALPSSP